MQWLWCWRCKCEMPMLDDQEYAEMWMLYGRGMHSSTQDSHSERFATMLTRYEAITGYRETNPNAVMHHRLSLYGLPCSCMAPRSEPRD
jgi:hypothetical protein